MEEMQSERIFADEDFSGGGVFLNAAYYAITAFSHNKTYPKLFTPLEL
jgi:hypothetical protein